VFFYYICYKFFSFSFLVELETCLLVFVLGFSEDVEEFFVDFFGGKYEGYSFELAVVTFVSSCEVGEFCGCGCCEMGVFASAEWAGDYLHNLISDML
jgi:hypothetical protein